MFATDEALAALPQGWFNHGLQVLRLLEEHRPVVVVELGTWLGASAIAMARSVRRWGGTVTCIDTWAGDMNLDGGSVGGPPLMILPCARAMVAAGVAANIRLIPSTTQESAAAWTTPIDFLYIDADHSEGGVCADLAAWTPHVRPGGLIVGDDYDHPLYPGVRLAWDAFSSNATHYQSVPPHTAGVQLVYLQKD